MNKTSITHFDIYPDQAQYRPGQQGNAIIELEAATDGLFQVDVEIYRIEQLLSAAKLEVICKAGERTILSVPLVLDGEEWESYGIQARLSQDNQILLTKATAYDIADHWRRAPRYGFLSDFRSEETGKLQDVESLNKFHINIVQFYDWMYRHDKLIPPHDEFVDPMGRELSYKVVREKVAAVQQKGMAAMAYGAVYAGLKDFLEEHKDWGLYKRNGEPFHLIDIFYIMDIMPESPWSDHIVEQFRQVVEAGFDGIHMDQYGFPKKAVRHIGDKEELVDLAECYPALIDRTKKEVLKINPEAGLIFNNVGNYPIHRTARSNQDALYIEVWPPVIHLRELKGLIDNAKALDSQKQVILSAYLPSFHPKAGHDPEWAENGAVLTMATIFASGGYHLLLGEDMKMLTTAYYPDYAAMRPSFMTEVRRYYDFIVRFGKLLYDHRLDDISFTYTGGVNTEITFAGDSEFAPNGDVGKVWTLIKRLPGYQILHLINLVGLDDDYWEHGKKQRPIRQNNIRCTVLMEHLVEGVYAASPDFPSGEVLSLCYEIVEHEQGQAIQFEIPSLDVWTMVYIKWADQ